MRRLLVTGGCGFIGRHLVQRLADAGCHVTVVDIVEQQFGANVEMIKVDIRDGGALLASVRGQFDAVVHLAARAGVRQSLSEATAYFDVNVSGMQNVLNLARDRGVEQFVFSSSSSVYGTNPNVPWTEDATLQPMSPYAASKISGEYLGYVASRLYGTRFIALGLFNVYGPHQRPDLAIHTFARAIECGQEVPVFGSADATRDFTFITDAIDAVCAATSYAGSRFEAINIGTGRPISLKTVIETLERLSGRRARIEWLPAVDGDLPRTHASIDKARFLLGYQPSVDFEDGLRLFEVWRRNEGTVHSLPHRRVREAAEDVEVKPVR